MPTSTDLLAVGEVARRAGVAVSTLHFYEREGLIVSERDGANHRRYPRSTLRRISFVRVSQRVGIPLAEIRAALDSLPASRTPTRADWAKLSGMWRERLDRRIADLQHLRDDLDDCMGCGCLSVSRCSLQNRDDRLGATGSGPRRWDGEAATDADLEVGLELEVEAAD